MNICYWNMCMYIDQRSFIRGLVQCYLIHDTYICTTPITHTMEFYMTQSKHLTDKCSHMQNIPLCTCISLACQLRRFIRHRYLHITMDHDGIIVMFLSWLMTEWHHNIDAVDHHHYLHRHPILDDQCPIFWHLEHLEWYMLDIVYMAIRLSRTSSPWSCVYNQIHSLRPCHHLLKILQVSNWRLIGATLIMRILNS